MRILIIILLFLSYSCFENSGLRSHRQGVEVDKAEDDNNGSVGSNRSSAGPSDGNVDGIIDNIIRGGHVELRHIVDPFSGTYKTKVTVPKNFKGLLHISGLNVTSLSDKLVYVRFNLGREYEPIEIRGVIGRAPGIIPQTDIEVITLDMQDQPFNKVRLLYDLFDYNDYDKDNDGVEEGEPTSDPRNGGLYCRGLNLEHDPTFNGSSSNPFCDSLGEKCLFSYAKIVDSSLYDSSNLSKIPSRPQIETEGNGYNNEPIESTLEKCLPDNRNVSNFKGVYNLSGFNSLDYNFPNDLQLNGESYSYKGPFRTIDRNNWQIRSSAVFSMISTSSSANPVEALGLFQNVLPSTPPATNNDINLAAVGGYKSFLFPRAGKLNLNIGIDYYGSSSPWGIRSLLTTLSNGESQWVDGCNLRVMNYDKYNNEGLSSCNVTATIEIFTRDDRGRITTLTSTNKVKLQIIRPSEVNFEGREVLYSSLKTCENSNYCSSDECCFNNRCWSKELVSQCIEDAQGEGNLAVGEACSSDYQCSSLCCNQSTGVCAVHVNNNEEKVLCSKSPGQSCIAREWCRKDTISQCFIIRTGFDENGDVTCTRQCYGVPTFGQCLNRVCVPPIVPDIPPFDSENPDCSNAIDPPTQL